MCDGSGLLIWGPIGESRRNEGVGESEREIVVDGKNV